MQVVTLLQRHFPFSDRVMGAAAVVLTSAANAAGHHLPGLLAALLSSVAQCNAEFPHGTVLESAAAVVETAAKSRHVQATEASTRAFHACLVDALPELLGPVFAAFAASPAAVSSWPVLFTHAFQLATTVLLHAPAVLVATPHLLTLLQAGAAVLEGFASEPDLTAAVAVFLAHVYHLATPFMAAAAVGAAAGGEGGATLAMRGFTADTYRALRPSLDAAAEGLAGQIAGRIVTLLAEGVSPEVTDGLGDAWVAAVSSYPAAAGPAAVAAFQSLPDCLPAAAAAACTPAVCQALCERAATIAAACVGSPGSASMSPFHAFVSDLIAICRGHVDPTEVVGRPLPPLAGIGRARDVLGAVFFTPSQ